MSKVSIATVKKVAMTFFKIVAILLLLFIGFVIAVMVFTDDKPSDKQNDGYEEVETERYKLQVLCNEKFAKDYICGIGEWTSNSKDTALQIATLHAKGKISTLLQTNMESNIDMTITESITGSGGEKITGIREYSKNSNKGNRMKETEICTIPDIKGNVSLVKIKGGHDFGEANIYYVLVDKNIIGSCIYQQYPDGEFESYTIKVGEGIPDIKIQETRTKYDQEKKEYTVYVLVTLPMNSTP